MTRSQISKATDDALRARIEELHQTEPQDPHAMDRHNRELDDIYKELGHRRTSWS